MVTAIFLKTFKLDVHSMGMGMNIRYVSVRRFAVKETQTIALEMAG